MQRRQFLSLAAAALAKAAGQLPANRNIKWAVSAALWGHFAPVPFTEVLDVMRDTGFIGYGSQHVGAANAAAVITGGSLSNDAGNQGVSVARFAAALAPHGSGVVLAGRDGSSDGPAAVGVARADATVTPVISTVDDLDAESGRVTAVLGAADLINGGRTGQYGTGHRNTGLTVAS